MPAGHDLFADCHPLARLHVIAVDRAGAGRGRIAEIQRIGIVFISRFNAETIGGLRHINRVFFIRRHIADNEAGQGVLAFNSDQPVFEGFQPQDQSARLMRDIRRPVRGRLPARARHDLEINCAARIGQDIGFPVLIMQAVFNAGLTRGKTNRRRLRNSGGNTVNFARRVVMRADLYEPIIIGTAHTDEKTGVFFFIGRVDFSAGVKNIAEPYSIGPLVFIPLNPEQGPLICRPNQGPGRFINSGGGDVTRI